MTNTANPFSRYYAEILLAEGLNSFALADVSTLSAGTLAPYDVVILGQTALTAAQVSTLTTWVNGGGNLIAMRPDKQLAGLLGLVDAVSTRAEGYLLVTRERTWGRHCQPDDPIPRRGGSLYAGRRQQRRYYLRQR